MFALRSSLASSSTADIGKAIAEASVKEMRRFVADEALLKRWGEAMARLFPDVKPGDHILGVYRPEGAVFLFNGQALDRKSVV